MADHPVPLSLYTKQYRPIFYRWIASPKGECLETIASSVKRRSVARKLIPKLVICHTSVAIALLSSPLKEGCHF